MLWSLSTPPKWAPNAIRTKSGWADPRTGELLVTINLFTPVNTKDQTGNARIQTLNECSIVGTSNIVNFKVNRLQTGTATIVSQTRHRIKGLCRIVCAVPYDLGINPNW